MNRAAKAGLLGLAVTAICAGAWAGAELNVTQKNKTFSATELTLHAGDTVHFHSEDTVTHNITVKSLTGDRESEDLGLQKPGQVVSYHFTEAGPYRVVCSIHPHMKLAVTVK